MIKTKSKKNHDTSDLERVIVGCMMDQSGFLEKIDGILKPKDFSLKPQRTVAEICFEHHEKGLPYDLAAIGAEVEKRGVDIVLISTFIDNLPVGLKFHAEQLKEAAARNRLLKKYNRIIALNLEPAEKCKLFAELNQDSGSSETSGTKLFLQLIQATDITPEAIEWIWLGYLAKGKLHIFAGPAGTGKTTIALSNASTISSGKNFPDGAQAAVGKVLIWSGEDDPQDTLLPRLLGMGGNPQNIFFVGDIRQGNEIKSFDPSIHMEALACAIEQIGSVSLLIIDPIVNAVGGDSHKNTEVRRALQPVVDLAANKGIAVIGITHFSKSTAGRNPVERVTGSIAFGALARVVLAAVKIEDDDGEEKRLFTRAKSNIGPDGGGFYFSIGQKFLVDHPEIQASSITWREPIEGDARTLLAQAETVTDSEEKGALSEAQTWLGDLLADVTEMEKTEIMTIAKKNNFSSRTVHRAREKLKVKYRTEGFGKDKKSLWSLPEIIRANLGIHAKGANHGTNDETQDSSGIEQDSTSICATVLCTKNHGTNGTIEGHKVEGEI